MSTSSPLQVADVEGFAWDEVADVVVVGLGAAGIVAAIESRERGADVMVVDRFEGGGATAVSGGVVYAGGGTHIQEEAGVEDSVDGMFRYLSMEVQDAVSPETLRHFCETSATNVRWLTDRGVPFYGTLCPIKTPYPTNEYHLFFSGNETHRPYADETPPVPRGHRTDGGAFPGANFIEPLRETAIRVGVRIHPHTRVVRLVIDEAGRVVGIEAHRLEAPGWRALHSRLDRLATQLAKVVPTAAARLRRRIEAIERYHSTPLHVRCTQAVVLAAGGFIFNREMVAAYIPDFSPGLPLGTYGDDGMGIRLGQSVGGRVDQMHRASAWRFLYPPNAFGEGMLINGNGERFANEFWYGAKIGEAMVERNGGVATLIIDRELRRLAKEQSKPGNLQWFQRGLALMNLYLNARRAKDVETLANMLDVPLENLRSSLDEYNASAEGKRPDPYFKDPSAMHPLRDGPFYAIDCSLGSKRHVCAVMTLGGLAVDEQTGQVLREGGGVVEGLYAAGRNAVGICSRQYVTGLSIADCVYSGLRAARDITRAWEPATKTVPEAVA